MKRWMLIPVKEVFDIRWPVTVFEHTPVDYFKYGEYPRWLNQPGTWQPRTEWKLVEVKDEI
jgi:hypothetical protein